MHDFGFVRPGGIDEVTALLGADPEAKLLAGGQTLIPTLKQRLAKPSRLIDLGGLPQLVGIAIEAGAVRIGAMTRHCDVAASPDILRVLPALARLAGGIGDPHVRHRGTIGGSVANNDPSADYPAACLALAATIHTDRRAIAADDYFVGLFETALAPDEVIISVSFPIPKRAAYKKFRHPASRYALAGVFVAQPEAGVRVAVTGAGSGVFRVPAFEAALAVDWRPEALDALAVAAADLSDDIHATRAYRAHLVKILAQDAVADAQQSCAAANPEDAR